MIIDCDTYIVNSNCMLKIDGPKVKDTSQLVKLIFNENSIEKFPKIIGIHI